MIFVCLSRNANYVTMPMTTLSINQEKNMRKIKNDPEMDFMILHKWFHENYMVLNPGKCHYIVMGDDDPTEKKIFLNNDEIASSNKENLIGIILDIELKSDSHITSLCKKAGQKT